MFTWICPKCGAEVSPSETDCPRCNKVAPAPSPQAMAPPPPAPAAAPPPPLPPAAAVPRTAAPPPSPTYEPVPVTAPAPPPPPQATYIVPAPKQGLPSWAVVLVVALLLVVAGWLGISLMRPAGPSNHAAAKKVEAPKTDAHPLAKHLEITGLRVTENANRKLEVKMVVINHSAAELPEMKVAVNLRSVSAKAGDEAISTFTVRVPGIGAFESQELKSDAVTKLRAYEFPDWQFLKADFSVVSP